MKTANNSEFIEVTEIGQSIGIDPLKFAFEGEGKKHLAGLMVKNHNFNVESFVKVCKVNGKFYVSYCHEMARIYLNKVYPGYYNQIVAI